MNLWEPLMSTLNLDHQNYFQTSKGHVTGLYIESLNIFSIPTHGGVAYKSIYSLARGHMIRVQ